MTDVKGKWALITGAARGIGRLTALFMARQGCNLILHSRELSHTEELLEQVKAMLRKIDEMGMPVDIVLNNAGLQIAYRVEYLDTPETDYTESFKINTVAPMMICYHFLPGMKERGFGRILNTTSGIRLDPHQAGYSASKAALDKVTIDLGHTVQGTNVMINLTDPGWCRTDLGGPNAPNAPESAIPGIVAGVFADDGKSGRFLGAQMFAGMTIGEAAAAAEKIESPY